MKRRRCASFVSFGLLLAAGFLNAALAVAATPSPTTTKLAILPEDPVAAGTVATLKATVSSSGVPVSPGLVLFCNAESAFCEDSNILGQAQLTASGTASLNVSLPIGTHLIRAEFRGTAADAQSSSSAESLTVTGKYPTATTFYALQNSGTVALIATLTGNGQTAPTGTVNFPDTDNHLLPIATSSVGPSNLIFTSVNAPSSTLSAGAVGDFNGDGKLDQIVYDTETSTVTVLFGNGDGTFAAGPAIPVATFPTAIAVGDFNNDDVVDLAVASYEGTVSVFLGKGDGTFLAPITFSVGSQPNYISVGDFNNDGNADLVVSSSLGTRIWLGNGEGGFSYFSPPQLPQAASPIHVADFKGNGKTDLAYIDSSHISVAYFGTGLGTFIAASKAPVSCGGNCLDMVVGDFNGDGKPDVAVASSSAVLVALGNGDGTFGSPTYIPNPHPASLAVADVNGDGKLDICEGDGNGQIGGLADPVTNIFLGNGQGSFVLSQTLANHIWALGDFNGDGLTDFALGSPTAVLLAGWQTTVALSGVTVTGSLGINNVFANYEGDAIHAASVSGIASVQGPKAATVVTLGVSPTPIAPGETMRLAATVSPSLVGEDRATGTITFSNGPNTLGVVAVSDGRAVLSTTTLPIGSNISLTALYSGNAAFNSSLSLPVHLMARGTLRPPSSTTLSVSPLSGVTQGTVVTLSASVFDVTSPVPTGLVIFYSSTSAHPGETVVGQAQLTASGVATMKFRPPPGSLGLKAVYQGTNTLASSESAPQSLNVTAAIATSTDISVNPPTYTAEVTAYGLLAASGEVSFTDATNANLVFATAPLGPSSTQFSLTQATPPNLGGGQYLIKVADFNGDGILDVAVITGGVTILLGNPDGTFTQKSTADLSGNADDMTVADFNGDGIPDIAVLQDTFGPGTVQQRSVALFLGRGDGTFISQPAAAAGSVGASALATGDFNGDGNADLLTTNFEDGTTSVLLGNGAGGFRLIQGPNLGGQDVSPAIVADFNGDGIPDVATLNYNSEEYEFTLDILLGNGDGTFVTSGQPAPCDPNTAITVADFNGDGFPDVLLSNCGSGMNLLLGKGNGTFTSSFVPAPQLEPIAEPAQAVTGDFNGDGITDLIVTSSAFAQVGVMLGRGDGTFVAGPIVTVPEGPFIGQLAVGDFNGDGVPDLLTTGQSNAFTGNQNVTSLSEWFSTITQTSQATATNVTLPGSGTQQVFAVYPGDATHIGSVSTTVPAAGAELTPQ